MKVLYINDIHFQESTGELYHTRGLLANLCHDLIIYYVTYFSNSKYFRFVEKINYFWIKTLKIKLFDKIHYYHKCRCLIQKESFDVVYIRESFFIFLFFLLNRKKRTTRYFLEINGIREKEASGIQYLLIVILNNILKRFYGQFEIIFVVSEGIKQFLADKYEYKNMIVLENGAVPGENTDKEKNDNSIIFAGGLSCWQNFEYFISCVKKNKEYLRRNHFNFLIFGTGVKEAYIQKEITALGLKDLIRLKGVISNSELQKIYQQKRYGLLLDNRIYNGYFLFSPLKYYEYKANRMLTLYFTDEDIILDQYKGIIIVTELNLVEVLNKVKEIEIEYIPRTWKDVACEVISRIL